MLRFSRILAFALYFTMSNCMNQVHGAIKKGGRTFKRKRDPNVQKRRQQMREMQRNRLLRDDLSTNRSNSSQQRESNHDDAEAGLLDLDRTSDDTHQPAMQEELSSPRLVIVEPPANAFIKGANFFVSARVEIEKEDEFWEKYSGAFVCISLDEAPWHCWPTSNGRMHFSRAIEGSHTVRAKLYYNGMFVEEFSNEMVQFTVVHNPDMATEVEHDTMVHLNHDNGSEDETEVVTINVPVVQMLSPADKVTYPGSMVQFRSELTPREPEIFHKYFNHSFVCMNIDAATAHTCFPIYGYIDDDVPFITGIDPGFHTFEVSISHPETRDLIDLSSSGTKTFLVSGDNDEAVLTSIPVEVDGKTTSIPISKGTDPLAQAKHFCASIYLAQDVTCLTSVSQRLSSAIETINHIPPEALKINNDLK